ncbi:hypothetical protein ACWN8V_04535 [Vagococcus elongatus]|uniref:Uncharacterized protein n=1 Tax=Vagococcus elongatus TaxID=180344 RepID=A0A430AYA5_9ENTE|nr:hypothetical protein [Vagococcus elongatus]RSU13026.1 hypothetical protein CBF29_04985 [Vagococcus elongatus]
MVKPQEVNSPKEKLEVITIIEDGTVTGKGYSFAKVKWKGRDAHAIRYDGDNDNDKGFPTSGRGYHPAWFILPDAVAHPYLKDLIAQKHFVEQLEKYF